MNATSRAADIAAGAAEAERIASGWRDEGGPGGAIVLFDASGVRAETAGGLADLSTGAPFTPDSVVRYASVTKHVFASRLLAHLDAVGLDDRLGDHLAELSGALADVTVARALDMSGGLPDVRETLTLLGVGMSPVSAAEPVMAFLGQIERLNYPAGTEVSYSNTGYRLVETALARRGLPFAELIAREIAAPLGIAWAAPETWFDTVAGLVPGYWRSAAGWQLGTAGLHLSASGCLAGSARSLARWLVEVVADRGPGAGVLARQGATRPLASGAISGYGLGLAWTTLGTTIAGRRLVGHGGSHVGYKTNFLIDPETKLGVAVVANREDVLAANIAQAVLAAALGLALPSAPHRLTPGLYVAAPGSADPLDWLEVTPAGATFLGAAESLWDMGDGAAANIGSTLPMRLAQTADGGIEGTVGLAPRRFVPATEGEDATPLAGSWRAPEFHAGFDIVVDAGGARLEIGVGPTRNVAPLRGLGGGRFLAEGADGPWPKRIALGLEDGALRLSLHRSRVLRFIR
jgi:CubicO group peptidase (beta-lactamase class C family)